MKHEANLPTSNATGPKCNDYGVQSPQSKAPGNPVPSQPPANSPEYAKPDPGEAAGRDGAPTLWTFAR